MKKLFSSLKMNNTRIDNLKIFKLKKFQLLLLGNFLEKKKMVLVLMKIRNKLFESI